MVNNLAFLDLGTPQLLIIAVIVLLLFGGKKLPELSRSLGTSMRELRNGLNDGDKQHDQKQATDNAQQSEASSQRVQ